MRCLRLPLYLFVMLSSMASTLAIQADDAPPAGKRVFTCGHSFHVFVPGILAKIAENAGIDDHLQVGLSSIGGSTVLRHWDVADEKNVVKPLLREGKIDVLTLSPIWLPEPGIEKFATLAFEHNPNVMVTVQEYWLPNDTYEPKWPLDTHKQVDHDAVNMDDLRTAHEKYFADFDGLVRDLNAKLGKEVLRVVPVGQAVLALREKVAAGTAPGLEKHSELFTDTWGHPTAPIKVLDAYCHYAVIYGRSPEGLPVLSVMLDKQHPGWASPELNLLLQQLAWDAVVQHPLSGVTVAAPHAKATSKGG